MPNAHCQKGIFKNQGIAIVSVLIIVAIVAIIATKMSVNHQRFVKSSQYMLNHQHQILLALSVEALAEDLLTEDLQSNNTDTFDDKWATINDFKEGAFTLSGVLIDQQSKINLNNLTHNQNKYLEQMYRLFDELDLERGIIDALIDYLDPNDSFYSSKYGAENSHYTTLEYPYKIANRAMADVSELRLIKGFDQAIIDKLLPWVWVASNGVNQININTAEKTVLKSLSSQMSNALIGKITQKQQDPDDPGFDNVDEFMTLVGDIGVDRSLITVSTSYFLLKSRVDNPLSGFKMNTFIRRSRDGDNIVLAKTRRLFL